LPYIERAEGDACADTAQLGNSQRTPELTRIIEADIGKADL
jgi:hypothetical protein